MGAREFESHIYLQFSLNPNLLKDIYMANQEVKKTLTVVDRSTKALSSAAEAIAKAATDLQGIATTANVLAQEIEFKQNELDNLEAQLVVKQREQAAELNLKVKEDADAVLATLLKERGLVTKTPAELKEVEKQLAEALEDNQEAVEAAVEVAVAAKVAEYTAKISSLESSHKVEIATLRANEKAAQERIVFLTQQNDKLEEQIAADREARIEIAKAEAQRQAVTVNTNGK